VIIAGQTCDGNASRREEPFFAYFLLALAQKGRRLSRRVSTVLILPLNETTIHLNPTVHIYIYKKMNSFPLALSL
jgi:hypothetical protein